MKTNGVRIVGPILYLRGEALLELAVCVVTYHLLGGSWIWFAALFLLPDLSMLGYLVNPSFGATLYNLGHFYMVPALLAVLFWAASGLWSPLWLIWPAHIAFDRVLGYGMKYEAGFRITHLGDLGQRSLPEA